MQKTTLIPATRGHTLYLVWLSLPPRCLTTVLFFMSTIWTPVEHTAARKRPSLQWATMECPKGDGGKSSRSEGLPEHAECGCVHVSRQVKTRYNSPPKSVCSFRYNLDRNMTTGSAIELQQPSLLLQSRRRGRGGRQRGCGGTSMVLHQQQFCESSTQQ